MNNTVVTLGIPGYKPPRQERGIEAVERIKKAFIDLLLLHQNEQSLSFDTITNNEIAKKAEVHIQSFYQWFENGKNTLVGVIALEYAMMLNKWTENFLSEPERERQGAEAFVRDFIVSNQEFYRQNPGAVLILYSIDIPERLRSRRLRARDETQMVGVRYLEKRGLGLSSYRVAETIIAIFFVVRQRFMTIDTNQRIKFDTDMENELERLLVGYLKPYFEPS